MPNHAACRTKSMQTEQFLSAREDNAEDFLKWHPEFHTGHNQIDQQHKKTFTLANKLYAAIKSKNHPLALSTIESYLEHLKWFSTYEECVLEEAFPRREVERHSRIHQQLIADAEHTYDGVCGRRKKPERFFFDVIVVKDIVSHQMEDNRIFSFYRKRFTTPSPS